MTSSYANEFCWAIIPLSMSQELTYINGALAIKLLSVCVQESRLNWDFVLWDAFTGRLYSRTAPLLPSELLIATACFPEEAYLLLNHVCTIVILPLIL